MRSLVLAMMMILGALAMTSPSWAKLSEKSEEPQINLNEPPFWMSSYDEFHTLRKDQKEFYSKELLRVFKKVPSLSSISSAKLSESAEWYEGWNEIRRKVYVACYDSSIEKICDELADLRVQTLNMYANQSEKNLKASGKSQEKDSKSKEPQPAKPAVGAKPSFNASEDPE